jgi:hypothetical protein
MNGASLAPGAGGKTALLASALDSRWAICYASCAGSMGSALEKRDYGENINDVAQLAAIQICPIGRYLSPLPNAILTKDENDMTMCHT